MASITLKGVAKRYGDVDALHETDLEIEDHEFLVLVGPSGSGKTTLLRVIAGLEPLSRGELYFGSRLVNDIDVGDRDIAMVFQNYGLYPHMSVFGNLAFGLRRRKLDKREIDTKVRESARMLGIEHLLGRRPKQLSGGQRQRVALGRAIVRDPAVFLLDEPLSNLDAHLRVQMRTEILKVHRTVTATAVYVTHDQVEAMTMGDRIAVMSDGVIQQLGTPDELYDRPANRFVAGFIGTPAMGFLPCTRTEAGADGAGGAGGAGAGVAGRALTGAGVRICLSARRAATLPGDQSQFVVGVRPEHLVPIGDSALDGSALTVEGVVELVEPLGSEQHVLVNVGEELITAKLPRQHRFTRGEKAAFTFDEANLHVFEPESGRTVR